MKPVISAIIVLTVIVGSLGLIVMSQTLQTQDTKIKEFQRQDDIDNAFARCLAIPIFQTERISQCLDNIMLEYGTEDEKQAYIESKQRQIILKQKATDFIHFFIEILFYIINMIL